MKPFFTVVLAVVFLTLTSFNHKFYVSTTNIQLDEITESFQITMKLFTDDLETSLGDPDHNRLLLGSDEEIPEAKQLIENYIKDNFSISVNDRPLQIGYLGKEVEYDLTYCYLEVHNIPPVNVMNIRNTIFIETLEGQTNIVNIRMKGSTQTLMFNEEWPERTIQN